jgi:cobalt-zinc-cadmium resistance protein CzcA
MIRKLVDVSLENRFIVLAAAILLFVWGGIAFHNLPVEAYPDVANNYVEVITQWPGISAEQIEQQVSIPLEIVMNGIPGLVHLRSFSLFGLSDIKLVFDDDTDNAWNRERVLERLSQVTMPPNVVPQMGTDWSPVGQIYFFTLHSTNPAYDVMELKSIEDWVIEKNFKAVPNVVDVASFGGPTREYQVRVDPNKLVSYGLSIGQVEQQLTNNNANAGGSFIEAGLQQINVSEVGLVRDVHDIENTVIMTKNGTPLHIRDIAVVSQGPKIRLGQFAKAIRRDDGKIIDNDDVVSGIVLLRKGADADSALRGIHQKVTELNDYILPAGVKVVPLIDRSDLVHFTTETVLHNLRDGIILVVIILFLFLGNVRGAIIVALTIPFALLFAATCLNLKGIPANLLSLGALDFGMVVDGAVVMVENIVRHLSRQGHDGRTPRQKIFDAAHEVQRPVFYAVGIMITAYQADGLDGVVRSPGSHHLFDAHRPCSRHSVLPEGHEGVAQPCSGVADRRLSPGAPRRDPLPLYYARRWSRGRTRCSVYLAERNHRFRISPPSGRGSFVGARHARPKHWSDRRHARDESGTHHPLFLARSEAVQQPSGPPGRRYRHRRLL